MRTAGVGSRLSSPTQAQMLNILGRNHLSRTCRPTQRPPGTRHFTAAAVLDTTVQTAQHLFTGLHHTVGLPWFLAIPTAALVVGLATRLPASVVARRAVQRRASLTPLLRAWYVRHARDAMSRGGGPTAATKAFEKTSADLYRQWGVQKWKDYANLAILPAWLVVMESLRRLCGVQGLLGTMVHGPVDVAGEGAGLVLAMDPSLATGGCLWFPSLMAADPLHVLPGLLGVVMLLNVMPQSMPQLRRFLNMNSAPGVVAVEGKTIMRVQRAMVFGALLVGPATANLPAALHLYWISSATFTLVQASILKRVFPVNVSNIQPCRGRESKLMRPKR